MATGGAAVAGTATATIATTVAATASADGDPLNELNAAISAGENAIDKIDDAVSVADDAATTASDFLDKVADDIADWVSDGGNDGLIGLKNKAGDFILRNIGNTRKFRTDILDTGPHLNPHFHLEWTNEAGKWVNDVRIWLYGVKPE